MSQGNKNSSKHRGKAPTPKADKLQHERFRDMARELGADESAGALDRAFAKLDPKKRPEKPAGK